MNKNGQALINSFTGVFNGMPELSSWLAATMPNTFGVNSGRNNLVGKTPQQVLAVFLNDFGLKDKLEAQVMAAALNIPRRETKICALAELRLVTKTGIGQA